MCLAWSITDSNSDNSALNSSESIPTIGLGFCHYSYSSINSVDLIMAVRIVIDDESGCSHAGSMVRHGSIVNTDIPVTGHALEMVVNRGVQGSLERDA